MSNLMTDTAKADIKKKTLEDTSTYYWKQSFQMQGLSSWLCIIVN